MQTGELRVPTINRKAYRGAHGVGRDRVHRAQSGGLVLPLPQADAHGGRDDRPRQDRRMTAALRTRDRMNVRHIAPPQGPAYDDAVGPAVSEARFQIRVVTVILLVLTALACVASFAHAGMGMMSGQDCFGPACAQQITCARTDQAPVPSSRQLAGPLATAVSSATEVSLPQSRTMALAPTLAAPSRRSVSPLAPRSPPAA